MPLEDIVERAAGLKPVARRGEVIRAGGVTIIDDPCNSESESLSRALAMLGGETRFERRVAVIGEMLELGAASASCIAPPGKRRLAGTLACSLPWAERAHELSRRARSRRAWPRRRCITSKAAKRPPKSLRRSSSRRRGPCERLPRHTDRGGGRSAQSGARLMLYNVLYQFHTQVPVLNVIQ